MAIFRESRRQNFFNFVILMLESEYPVVWFPLHIFPPACVISELLSFVTKPFSKSSLHVLFKEGIGPQSNDLFYFMVSG